MAKAMNDTVVSALTNRAGTFGWRFKQLKNFHFTHDEMLHLTAPAFHHELLKTAATVADVASTQGTMKVHAPYMLDGVERPQIDLRMVTFEGKEPPLMPKTPTWQPCDLAIQKKVTDWYEHFLYTGRMVSTVKWLVGHLNDICDNGHQVRCLWPAILHLAAKSEDEKVQKWVDKYGVRITTRTMPRITPKLRNILGDTTEWCAQGVLLEEIKKAEMGQCIISWGKPEPFRLDIGDKVVQLTRDTL